MRIRIPYLPFMRHSTKGLIFSSVLTITCVLLIVIRGFNYGLDFAGGATMQLHFENPVPVSEIRTEVKTLNPDATVVQYGSASDIEIKFVEKIDVDSSELLSDIFSEIKAKHADVTLTSQAKISGQYKSELVEKGIIAFLLSSFGIIVYLAIRFEWKFAVSAVASQLHDVIVTAAVFSLMQWTFDLNVLAALLAVLGYSVNDTVVVFDRIRENFRKVPNQTTEQLIDLSINQTMTRTLVTSFTTILAVLALLLFGGESLFGFSAAMLIGIVFGTYSSIYVASGLAFKMRVKPEDLIPKTKEQLDDLP